MRLFAFLIPHRFPMLLVEKIVDVVPGAPARRRGWNDKCFNQ